MSKSKKAADPEGKEEGDQAQKVGAKSARKEKSRSKVTDGPEVQESNQFQRSAAFQEWKQKEDELIKQAFATQDLLKQSLS